MVDPAEQHLTEIYRAARRAGRRYALVGVPLADESEVAAATLAPLVHAARTHDPSRGELGAFLRVVADRKALSYVRSLVGYEHERMALAAHAELYRDDQGADGRAPHAASADPLPDAGAEYASSLDALARALRGVVEAGRPGARRDLCCPRRLRALASAIAAADDVADAARRSGLCPTRVRYLLRKARPRLAGHLRP